MRRRARVDGNHNEVVKALREAAMEPVSLAAVGNGIPDLLVGFRGVNVLLEVKDGDKTPGNRPLTAAQESFHATWPGQIRVVTSAEEAVTAVAEAAKAAGAI